MNISFEFYILTTDLIIDNAFFHIDLFIELRKKDEIKYSIFVNINYSYLNDD